MKNATKKLIASSIVGGAVLAVGIAVGYTIHKTKINKFIDICYAGAMAAGAFPIVLHSNKGDTLHMIAFDDTTNIHEQNEDWTTYKL